MSQIKVPVTPLSPRYLCLERYNIALHFYQLAKENAVHTSKVKRAPLNASAVQITYRKVKHEV